jgi:hypothetical protein
MKHYLAHDLHVGDGVRPLGSRDEQEGVTPARVELPQAGLGVSGLLLKRKSSGNWSKKGGNSLNYGHESPVTNP